jgi:hypothetical protein
MGGLIVGTVLTLAFVPALYAAWFRVRADMSSHTASLHSVLSEPPPIF